MKPMKRLLAVLLALLLLLPLSLTATVAAQASEQKTVSLTVGQNETERNVTWHSNIGGVGKLQFAERKGSTFPSSYREVTAATETAKNDTGYDIHRATMTALKPNTEYVYRLVNGTTVSEVYEFKTNQTGDFNFLFTGDPQIASSSNVLGWTNALMTMRQNFPEAQLLVTAGDQVNTAGDEEQYRWYLTPYLMQSYANAPVIGNHDTSSRAFSEHFNLPNTKLNGKIYCATPAGKNYWYTYNDVLFIHLNTNSTNYDEHILYLERVLEKNPDAKWHIVALHQTMFSLETLRWNANATLTLRNALAPAFDRLGIDLVLMGHDHTYVRTHLMDGLTPIKSDAAVVTDPQGVLYVAGGSGSGSKYYDIDPTADTSFVAKYWQGYSASFSLVEVSEGALKLTTYQASDMSVIDTFALVKEGYTLPSATTTTTTKQTTTTTAKQTTTTTVKQTTASTRGTSVSQTTLNTGNADVTTTVPSSEGSTDASVTVTTTVSTTVTDAVSDPSKPDNGWIVWVILVVAVCAAGAAVGVYYILKKKR